MKQSCGMELCLSIRCLLKFVHFSFHRKKTVSCATKISNRFWLNGCVGTVPNRNSHRCLWHLSEQRVPLLWLWQFWVSGDRFGQSSPVIVMIDDWWWMMDDGWWMMDDGWWMTDDGWWMMVDDEDHDQEQHDVDDWWQVKKVDRW